MRTLKTGEMKEILKKPDRPPVINVLPAESHQEKHIPGSENVPVDQEQFVQSVEQKVGGKDEPVILYCASTQCDASPRAARKLEAAGFSRVMDYEEGVAGWEEAGLPLESGA